MRDPKTPNVIIAGVTKAGTTSLFTYLADHPEVCASSKKEISHYVSVRFREPRLPLEDYHQYYQGYSNEPITLESSPAYFLGGKELAQAIQDDLPDARVVLVLREPVSRCVSHFRFSQNMLQLPREMTLEEYFHACQEFPYESFRERGSYVYYGLASGAYSNYLQGWLDVFGDRLYVCFFDDLKQDPGGFLKRLCQELGVAPGFYDNYNFVVENQGRNFGNSSLQNAALKLNKRFEPFLRRNLWFKRMLRNAYYAVNGRSKTAKKAEDPAVLEKLGDYYAPFNETLRQQLSQANTSGLPEWLKG